MDGLLYLQICDEHEQISEWEELPASELEYWNQLK